MADATVSYDHDERNEDYTGSVCLLHMLTPKYPVYEEVLVDIGDFDWLQDFQWRLTTVCAKSPSKRVVRRGDNAYLSIVILNPQKGMIADHKSRRPMDNRRRNLRVVTTQQNNINASKQKNKTSRFKGVHRNQGKWKVQVGVRGKRRFLGHFGSEVEAARAYNEWAKTEFGEFAALNRIDSEEST